MQQAYDMVVIGGGLVGASCALALANAGYEVALIESRPHQPQPPYDEKDWDSRIYALTPGSVAWLQHIGAWQHIPISRVCDITAMQISGDAPEGALRFSAEDACANRLGVIVESNTLQTALWTAIRQAPMTLLDQQATKSLQMEDGGVTVTLSTDAILRTALVVGADGARSWVRTQAGIPAHTHDYGQMGVVANFETTLPHRNTAWQWFTGDGILAWLPLPGNRISMVWSLTDDDAQKFMELGSDQLSEHVGAAGGNVLGTLKLINAPQAFPLLQMTAASMTVPGVALVGDAAHLVHPMAGQGVNLGFRDVQALLEVLATKKPMQSFGDAMLLRAYERARKSDIVAMQAVTRGLATLFGIKHPIARASRNWGLGQTNRHQSLKKLLMHQAMR